MIWIYMLDISIACLRALSCNLLWEAPFCTISDQLAEVHDLSVPFITIRNHRREEIMGFIPFRVPLAAYGYCCHTKTGKQFLD